MKRIYDLPIGTRFGNLVTSGTPYREMPQSGQTRTHVDVRCDCGNIGTVQVSNLRTGHARSCGCSREKAIQSGTRFGHLVVEDKCVEKSRTGRYLYRCVCDCGSKTSLTANALRTGHTTSCGCRMGNHTHGSSISPEYRCWQGIKTRCLNENSPPYKHYGGRGVTCYSDWAESFEAFLRDVGPRPSPQHSLDRIDVNGNYEPGNVRWATRDEQALNKRNSPKATFKGTTMTVGQWAYDLKLDINWVKANLAKGLTPYESVFLGYPRTKARREKLNWKGVAFGDS